MTIQKKYHAFTMIEILIVIAIAGILSMVTLNMNRGRIQQMQNLNERELRIDWHTSINREITNTNYFQGEKIESISFDYISGNNKVIQSGGDIGFLLNYHTITSGSLSFTKTALELGCKISTPDNKIYMKAKSDKIFCFELKPSLCTRSLCN